MSSLVSGPQKTYSQKTRVYTVGPRCDGCGTCVTTCSRGAVTLVNGRAQVHPGRCEACGQCVSACPRGAKKFVLRAPDEAQIRAALDLMGRMVPRDEFDCGACGFQSCREKAISVCLGLSPADACVFAPRNGTGPRGASSDAGTARRPALKDVSKDRAHEEEAHIIAYSAEMGKVLQIAARVARVNTTTLILGESGVGKEVIARFIHRMGDRKDGPFVKVNCGAIPETLLESELFGYETGAFTGARKTGKPGLIEMASGGIFFLDEVCELPLSLQVKLLQVLQEKQVTRLGGTKGTKVDVRILAATNRDIHKMVQEGSFRSDLFYRLNVVPIVVPPLRERKDDIVPLLYHFLDKLCRRHGMCKSISEGAKEALVNYDWPGNVRELENLVERLVVTAEDDEISLDDLPEYLRLCPAAGTTPVVVSDVVPLKDAVEEVERQIIEKAVSRYHNTYKIAEVLGINQSTVVRKIQKYCRREAGSGGPGT